MMMTDVWQSKVVLLLGEVNSLSLGIVSEILSRGAIVIFPARSLHLVSMINDCNSGGNTGQLVTLVVDVFDYDKMNEICETILEKYGHLDMAISIASMVACDKSLAESSFDEWNGMIDKEVTPFFMGAKIVMNHMKVDVAGIFLHITEISIIDGAPVGPLNRVAYATRMELARVFAEEANASRIRYYSLQAQAILLDKGQTSIHNTNYVTIIDKIMSLYLSTSYTTTEALQYVSF